MKYHFTEPNHYCNVGHERAASMQCTTNAAASINRAVELPRRRR